MPAGVDPPRTPRHKTVYRNLTEAVVIAFRKQRVSRAQQPSLFQARTAPPPWHLLPELVRKEALEHVGRMLQEHWKRQAERVVHEVSDE